MGRSITVRKLIAQLERLPPGYPVMFLNTDYPEAPAVHVEEALTVSEFRDSLHSDDAAKTVKDAGLTPGQAVICGC